MLSFFYIRNFRSILELKLDFTYGEGKAPNGYRGHEIMPFIEAPNKLRLVPCMAFFGANASGKTNILKAFGALKQLLREGRELNEVYEPNLLNPKFADTTLAAQFLIAGDLFQYRITYDEVNIQEEVLLKNDQPVFTIRNLHAVFSKLILSANYSNDKLTDILRVECSDGEGRQTKLFLNRIGDNYPGLNTDFKNVFIYLGDQVKSYANTTSFPLPQSVKLLSSVMDGDEKAALRAITDIVQRLDIDISDIDIVKRETPAEDDTRSKISILRRALGVKGTYQISAVHKDISGNPTLFDFIKHESAGTKRLAGLVGLILHALKTGGVLLVDELECSLHPLLMREIVLLFKKRSHNSKGAQLIITTHNTDILDDSILRISEIALVRKTLANGTLVRRLADAKKDGDDIRNVTNFRKQYLAGFYSGVPHPAL